MTGGDGQVRDGIRRGSVPPPTPARANHRLPAPEALDPGHPGRLAVVQTQVALVALVVVVQLLIVTQALDQLLSGRGASVWPLAAVSTVLLGLVAIIMRARG